MNKIKKFVLSIAMIMLTISIYTNVAYANKAKCGGGLAPQLYIVQFESCYPVCGDCAADIVVN